MKSSDIEKLIAEIARYLETVEIFRAERCEPTWRPELWPARETLAVRLAAYGKTATSATA
jgi:hypothetical protein